MKAPIFMKFETYIHKIVKNYQKIFRNDPCTHVRTDLVVYCKQTTKQAVTPTLQGQPVVS